MTTDEFVERVRTAIDVGFPGGGRFVPGPLMRYALQDALSRVLPKGEVLCGVELARLEYDRESSRGHTEFLLLLDSHVVRVKGTLTEGPRTLSFEHQMFPLSTLQAVTVTTDHQQGTTLSVHIRSVRMAADFTGGASLKASATLPDIELEPLLVFARQLLAAHGLLGKST